MSFVRDAFNAITGAAGDVVQSVGDIASSAGQFVGDNLPMIATVASLAGGVPPGLEFGTDVLGGAGGLGGEGILASAGDLAGPSFAGGALGSEFGVQGDLKGLLGGGNSLDEILAQIKKYGPAFNLGTGLYGLLQADKLGRVASSAAARSDPFAGQRGIYQQQLAQLTSNPNAIFDMPSYKVGEQAVNRGMAKGGYTGSGNQAVALRDYGTKFYNDQVAQLAGLSGANINPGYAGNEFLTGNIASTALTGQALNRIGAGIMRS